MESNPFKVILPTAECLAWALPEPYGAIAAGALTFFDALFMSDSDGVSKSGLSEKDISSFLQAAVQEMERYIQNALTERDREDIATFTTWFSSVRAVLKMIGNDAPYLEKVLQVVDRMTTPGAGTLLNALEHIEAAYERYKPEDLDGFKEKLVLFDTIMASMSTVMFATRMKLLLSSLLTGIYEKQSVTEKIEKANGLWLGYYAELLVLMHGGDERQISFPEKAASYWSALSDYNEINGVLNKEIDGVLSKWAEKAKLYPINVIAPGANIPQGALLDPEYQGLWAQVKTRAECVAFFAGWGDPGRLALATGSCPPDPTPLYEELGKRTQGVQDTINKWRSAGSDWYDHRPPLAPVTAVQVHEPWAASVPQPPNWIANNAVGYAVVYQNAQGRSPIGPFCDWVKIVDKAFPTISVPPDPLGMATKILVYRRFRTAADKHYLIKELVGGQVQFQDCKV